MIPKILFLVLVGCALVLATPVEREALKEGDVPKQSEEIKIHEIVEEQSDEIYKDTEEKISQIFTDINEGMNDEDFKKALNDVKKIVDKFFKEQIFKELEEQKEESFNVLL